MLTGVKQFFTQAVELIEDLAVPMANKIGLFEVDAELRVHAEEANLLGSGVFTKLDSLGISNKAVLARYNARHPESPVVSPYAGVHNDNI